MKTMNWVDGQELQRWDEERQRAEEEYNAATAAGHAFMEQTGGRIPPLEIQERVTQALKKLRAVRRRMP